ncbi:MAG: hypothetical protein ACI9F9_000721 [Candidatus Paceibacteria bacterium]|jgi:hypothetical protein
MNQSYDANTAESLIPLLRVMNRELHERNKDIKTLSRKLGKLAGKTDVSKRELRILEGHLFAQIANHKREVRVTKRELLRLGCSIDETDTQLVLIPGEDGEFEGGYAWHVGEVGLQALQPD